MVAARFRRLVSPVLAADDNFLVSRPGLGSLSHHAMTARRTTLDMVAASWAIGSYGGWRSQDPLPAM
jgi:hypothetical protein